MIEITLPHKLLYEAAIVGVKRHLQALANKLPDRHGADPDRGWQNHVEGACGEAAYALARGRPVELTIGTFRRQADFGDACEVRTRSEHHYDLIVRRDDDPQRYYVLVTGRAPTYRVHGWILGADARRPAWLHAHGGREPAYFVPQGALHPFAKKVVCRG